jgi:hypothetical protein
MSDFALLAADRIYLEHAISSTRSDVTGTFAFNDFIATNASPESHKLKLDQ